MGVNAIRQYVGHPAALGAVHLRAIRHLHRLNHLVGALRLHPGRHLDPLGRTTPTRGCARRSRPRCSALVEQYRDTPGVLMWLLGNENNYGLSWTSFEIEALPEGERDAARARYLYSLFGEIIDDDQGARSDHPGRRSPTATSSTSTSSPRSARTSTSSAPTSTAGSRPATSSRWSRTSSAFRSCSPSSARDAFNAEEMREDQAMQARYLARPVGGDLRAVRRQGARGQRDRRLDLPVERRLVEVRAGRAARHPRHQRLVAQRRLRRGLRRRARTT